MSDQLFKVCTSVRTALPKYNGRRVSLQFPVDALHFRFGNVLLNLLRSWLKYIRVLNDQCSDTVCHQKVDTNFAEKHLISAYCQTVMP